MIAQASAKFEVLWTLCLATKCSLSSDFIIINEEFSVLWPPMAMIHGHQILRNMYFWPFSDDLSFWKPYYSWSSRKFHSGGSSRVWKFQLPSWFSQNCQTLACHWQPVHSFRRRLLANFQKKTGPKMSKQQPNLINWRYIHKYILNHFLLSCCVFVHFPDRAAKLIKYFFLSLAPPQKFGAWQHHNDQSWLCFNQKQIVSLPHRLERQPIQVTNEHALCG